MICLRQRRDLALEAADEELAEDYTGTLTKAGFLDSSQPADRVFLMPIMLDCLLVRAVLPTEQHLLEMEPVDLARRKADGTYLDATIVDSIVLAVSNCLLNCKTRRQIRRCLCDKLRHLRNLRVPLFEQKCKELITKYIAF